MRIRIQHFRLNTDPDPGLIRIHGVDDKKVEKIYSSKFFLNQKLKLQFTCP
jgi:hypothetical protein